jgi:predicted helicase
VYIKKTKKKLCENCVVHIRSTMHSIDKVIGAYEVQKWQKCIVRENKFRDGVAWFNDHNLLVHRCQNATASFIGGMPPIPDYNGNVLISTFSLAYEGLDIPQLDTLILTTPHSDVVQAMGRIMRRAGTKEIWDIVDHWSIFESMWYKRNATYKGPKEKKCIFT